MISGLIGGLAKKQRRPERNSGLNGGLGPMTVRLCCNALPSQPSEIHVYSMSAQRTHFQMA